MKLDGVLLRRLRHETRLSDSAALRDLVFTGIVSVPVLGAAIAVEVLARLRDPWALHYRLRDTALPLALLFEAITLCWFAYRRLRELDLALVQRRQMREALRDSNEMLSTLVDASPLSIVSVDRAGLVRTWNRAARELFGYPEHEVVGRPVTSLERSLRGAGRIWRALANPDGEALRGVEVKASHRGGATVYLSASTAPLTDERGRTSGAMAILADVTERKLLEQRVLTVQEREQRRLGQDLHDGIGQTLTGVGLMSHAVARRLDQKQLPEAADVQRIEALIHETLTKTRELARGLYPVELEDGLLAGLEALGRRAADLLGVQCRMQLDEAAIVQDPATALHLYRIAQEAIDNAVRHGHARWITLSLARADGQIALTVVDDGCGFDTEHAPRTGMGLTSMEDRASRIRGALSIQSRPAEGTTVRCVVGA